jgi:uncharacterized membrane protein YqjE
MAITAAVGRIGAGLLAMVGTRLELAAIEVREEARHALGSLALALLAALLAGGACMLAAMFVIVLFWDSHRLLAVGAMAASFAVAALVIVLKVRAGFAARPPLLSATLAELRRDAEFVKATEHPHEQ